MHSVANEWAQGISDATQKYTEKGHKHTHKTKKEDASAKRARAKRSETNLVSMMCVYVTQWRGVQMQV